MAFKISTNTKQRENRADLIWSIADKIRGLYKPHEYGKVILPFTVIKRFADTLLPIRDAVLEANKKYKDFEVKDTFLFNATKTKENPDGYKLSVYRYACGRRKYKRKSRI
ncbi:MAG: type I restriction-modification system subunit M N-terminal domain-containing protein [Clostridiales bacterium]|jgi:type I restriction enzyme M protein|nr:type I restriction-modification system subunit M N-terminal domain-containing protein [Clostridiales bacterium]